MKFQEKTLESNITHELLNLADSWYWFLTDIPLWRYWRPRYRLPFIKHPKSTSAGFHITTEGKDDPTGNAGGGFDMRIKAGFGKHLLFIQFKKGELTSLSPDPSSEFAKPPHDHYTFEINGTTTNQHFVLRNLANGIGKGKNNAVVYALPLINDMADLEANAGKLVRKTKFISIADVDFEAAKANVTFTKGQVHNFRVSTLDMNRCEVNYFYFFFDKPDRAPEIISDIITTRFQKTLAYFLKEIKKGYESFGLFEDYIPFGIQQSFIQFTRYLLHYFEVSPNKMDIPFFDGYSNYFHQDEFEQYKNIERDVQILNSTFKALAPFAEFIFKLNENPEQLFSEEIPSYAPQILIPSNGDNGINIEFDAEDSKEVIESVNYLIF
ncbi:hypothetical protein [Mucilaginibacter gotjawali]|uniref:Uncharacterized protein n=2 Tax=Mucilaginibacter gotjawali TaxID=1550579 RepID=A0A839SKZ4_9SPHI|nr:hypothetical protein [Mucilaginibacter gotjawali]MBB3057199.1 hypothetical protein [Mucilaginibacter gotjawali]BAU53034.1 hypothetical protein MgSA37_01201 [Mucilaginibacter gotjawali]